MDYQTAVGKQFGYIKVPVEFLNYVRPQGSIEDDIEDVLPGPDKDLSASGAVVVRQDESS